MSEHEDMMALRDQHAATSIGTQVETSRSADNDGSSHTMDAIGGADVSAPTGIDAPVSSDIEAPVKHSKRKRRRPPKISLHSDIESQLIDLDLLEHELEDQFRSLLHSTVDDIDARPQTEQQIAFRRSHQIVKDLRIDRLAVTLINREMREAAVAVFKRLIDPDGKGGLEIEAKARELAEDNFDGRGYNDLELSSAGLGQYSIETEAALRALPYLSQLDKMRSANQRDKIGTLKELELWRRITGKNNEWQPKSKSPRTGATPAKAQVRARNKARRVRK